MTMTKRMINIIVLLIGILTVLIIGCETTTQVHNHHYTTTIGSNGLPLDHPPGQPVP